MDRYGVVEYAILGANFPSKMGFSNKVCRLIALLINANRCFSYIYPEYYDQTSEASKYALDVEDGIASIV